MSTVLLLQMDAELVDIWRVALESSGHAVLSSYSAKGGAVHVRDGGIDVVVVDSDDREIARMADAIDAAPDAPSLVLVSASPTAPETSVRVGAAAFLPKPCSPGELDQTIRRLSGNAPRTEIPDDPTLPHQLRHDLHS